MASLWRSVWRSPGPRTVRRGRRPPRALVRGRGEEDRCAEAIGVLRTEALDVVLVRDVHAARSELGVGQGRMNEVASLDRDHASRRAVADEIDGDVRERDRDGLIERVGVAAAQVVRELAGERLFAGALPDLVGEHLGDIRLVAMPEGVRRPVLRDRAARPARAFGGDDEGVTRRVVALVLDEDLDEA